MHVVSIGLNGIRKKKSRWTYVCMQLSCGFENQGGIRNKKTRSETYAATTLLKIRVESLSFSE